MVRVKVTQEGRPLSELTIEQPVTIGRVEGTGLRLDKSTVSSRHAQLEVKGLVLFVRDLGSTNGTSVNGQKLQPNVERPLAKGDKITISTFEILVTETHSLPEPETKDLPREPARVEPPKAEPPRPEAPKAEPPRVEASRVAPPKVEVPRAEPPKAEPPRAEPPRAEPPRAEPPRVVEHARNEPAAIDMTIAVGARIQSPLANLARLKHAQPRLVMATKERRAVFELVKSEAIIGRDPQSDVVIDHGTVSKRHAEIRLLDGTFFVRDLGTVNGTFVDGSAVVGAAAPVKSHQTLRFGTVSCLFLTRPPEGTETQEEQAAQQVARLLVSRGVVPPGQMESLQAMVRSSGRSLAELAVTAGVVEPEAWSKLRSQVDVIEMVQESRPDPRRWIRWLALVALVVLAAWAGARWWPRH